MKLENLCVVTGGTRGIGSVIAHKFRKEGRNVLTVSRNKVGSPGHLSIDLSKESEIDQLKQKLQLATIENLVLSHRYRGPDLNEEIMLMLTATSRIIDALKSNLSNPSSIVIVGSKAANQVYADQRAEYHASRGGLDSLMRYFAVNLGKYGIRCNSVLPGTILKPENVEYYSSNSDLANAISNVTPLKRMGTAEDVADVVSFLCSNSANFLTGHSLIIDGGLRLIAPETLAVQ